MEEDQLGETSFLERLFEIYQSHPETLDNSWRVFFQSLDNFNEPQPSKNAEIEQINTHQHLERIQHLIETYRRFGHLLAKVNSLDADDKVMPAQLKIEWIGFSEEELEHLFPTLRILEKPYAPLKEIIQALQNIYCFNIGFEFKETDLAIEQWIQDYIERTTAKKTFTQSQRLLILRQLNRAELFENFLHTKYIGQKRFSLEGAETLIPMLTLLLEKGAEDDLQEVVIGMAHRGRLNVLANILNKSYDSILAEFDESYIPPPSEGMGDVKYHKGYKGEYTTSEGNKITISLPPNPSHLESIYPVVEGQVRAKQYLIGDEATRKHIVPILIHGDAAVSGQGIVYETLQFNHLEGYKTGGTIHLIINNQIGFTTTPKDSRSTLYCTAIAKTFGLPVFHVNAEDPEGCVHAMTLAYEIRQKFHCDVFVDLNCYRKYGHNEGDEPAFTQPLEYQIIRNKRPIRQLYHDDLIKQGIIEKNMVDQLEAEFREKLLQAHVVAHSKGQLNNEREEQVVDTHRYFSYADTSVSKEILEQVTIKFSEIPDNFKIHAKIEALVKERLKVIKENGMIDWALAEHLAFATLLWEGTSIRLSGQDSERGTFSQRHAVWMDQLQESEYQPLAHLKQNQGRFEVYNSSLSEMGVLGFEYGYSVICLKELTIWEAQYGDFNNGAQIIIDQYISSGEEKWGQKCGLVLFLPHGYEGQGPEHSSGRLERFLALSNNDNMTIANPSTPAQFFHLLRHQIKAKVQKPLIVFTPKGLLRLPACRSPLSEFEKGHFQTVIDDTIKPKIVTRLIFCSGHIYYDLIAKRTSENLDGFVIIRIEQLNPLDEEQIRLLINHYFHAKDCYWVQEEPQNMGAWSFMLPYLTKILPPHMVLRYAGRKASATPATGSRYYHEQEQVNLLKQVFQL